MVPILPDGDTQSIHPASDPREIARQNLQRPSEAVAKPERIGPYKILETLGEGGMGVVYLAEQSKPIHRRVALKIIKLGMDTKQVIARFETEREALALMNHPNVAKVFDAGATETGRPYFVMEYVPGIPITEYCDKHRLTTEERLRLFMDVCNAIQHAHQKGIIHRDIKPSNVLVSVDASVPIEPRGSSLRGSVAPSLRGFPKVIDFGVAKATQHRLTERTLFTEQGQLLGTPGYMSPEQAEMTALDIDTRTDIYSLGVLLYELLVGAMPFDTKTLLQAGLAEIQRIIREVDPPKPSTKLSMLQSEPRASAAGKPPPLPRGDSGGFPLEPETPAQRPASTGKSSIDDIAHRRHTEPKTLIRQIRGDLDWIVMRAMEKDRTRRYDTATALAEDVLRHLRQEAVVASPPSKAYLLTKFLLRNKGPVTAVAAIILALSAGLSVAAVMYARAEHARAEATSAEEHAQSEADKAKGVNEFLQNMLSSIDPSRAQGRDVTVREILDEAGRKIEAELAGQPDVQVAVRETIAGTYKSLGLYAEALTHGRRVLEYWQRTLGDGHPKTIESMVWIGDTLYENGQTNEALVVVGAVLDAAKRRLGDEHPISIEALSLYGNMLRAQDRLNEAEPHLARALELAKRVHGEEHDVTSLAMFNFAALLRSLNRFPEAEPLYHRAAEIRERLNGPEHQWTLRVWYELAEAYFDFGQPEKGEKLFRETLEKLERGVGKDHPERLKALDRFAWRLRDYSMLPEAVDVLRQALTLRQKRLGDENAEVANTLDVLAWDLSLLGNHAEAEELERKSLRLRRKLFGDEHVDVAESLNNLAVIVGNAHKFDEAAQLHDEALRMRRSLFGNDHRLVVESLSNQATLAKDMGEHEKAEDLFRQALAIDRKLYGKDDLRIASSHTALITFLEPQGKWAEAELLAREALAIRREKLGDGHPATLTSIAFLGMILNQNGKPIEAESVLRECLAARERTLQAGDWLIPNTASLLAESLILQGRYAEGEPLATDSYLRLKDAQSAQRPRKTQALQRVVMLYEKWAAAEPGKGYAEKAAEWRAKLEDREGTKPRSDGATKGSSETPKNPDAETPKP